MESLQFLMSDIQKKLGRTLKEEEINFLKWMVKRQTEEKKESLIQHQ